MTRIILDNLTRHYPRQPAPTLDRLSLVVGSGEMLALLGPSGSGKSTILKLIAGIDTPDGGDIRFHDRSILPVAANQRGAVLMFQKAYLFPFLRVGENIGFGLKVQGSPRATTQAEVGRMLDLVGLPGIERKFPAQLSGGEQQRVALARALITRPQVLLLDEPLSSLDTAVRGTLQEAIRRIQRDLGITALLVTHDLSEAVAMSDRTALLLNGVIEACDRPQQLFQRPPTRAAARFVGVSTFLEGDVRLGVLHTPAGSLTLPPGERRSGQATFAVRPEHIRLLASPAANALPGTVSECFYRGEYSEYEIDLAGQAIRVRVYHIGPEAPAPGGVPAYHRGATVYVQIPPECLFELYEPAATIGAV